jgi:hypothetical protein
MDIISDFESEDTGSIPVFPTNTQRDKTFAGRNNKK